jgi:hypothetical protein
MLTVGLHWPGWLSSLLCLAAKIDADEQTSSEDSTNNQCHQEGHAHLIDPFINGDCHAIAPIKVSGEKYETKAELFVVYWNAYTPTRTFNVTSGYYRLHILSLFSM